jgi:non-ribosomal peptide synthetase component F
MPYEAVELPGLQFEPLPLDSVTAKFDLTFFIHESPSELQVTVEYAQELYEGRTIERLSEQFAHVLEQMVLRPRDRLGQISVLREQERHQLLHEWNATQVSSERGGTLVQLFEEQVRRTPQALAVEYEGEQLSYAQLNERVNQVAHYLIAQGVEADSVVGLCAERSVQMVVGLLGIVKAGCAYLPLDPSYPAERLRYMVQDAQARVVLLQEKWQQRWQEQLREHSVRGCVLGGQEIGEQARTDPDLALRAEQLAYVIYTSGSTGRPKGVMITHAGLSNYLNYALERYRVSEGSGAPVNTTLSFDATVTSLLLPLVSGCAVRLLHEGARELMELGESLAQGAGYSLVKLTPAHLWVLQDLCPQAARADAARAFIIGGEALTAERVQFWRERAPGIRLINEYGPT